MNTYEFAADLWRYTGQAAWYFVTLPHDVADDIDESFIQVSSSCRREFTSDTCLDNLKLRECDGDRHAARSNRALSAACSRRLR